MDVITTLQARYDTDRRRLKHPVCTYTTRAACTLAAEEAAPGTPYVAFQVGPDSHWTAAFITPVAVPGYYVVPTAPEIDEAIRFVALQRTATAVGALRWTFPEEGVS